MTRPIIGVSHGFHDAALALIHDDQILYAAHAERFSRQKNDKNLNRHIVTDMFKYSPQGFHNMDVVYYEKPWLKKTRELYTGQRSDFHWKKPLKTFFPKCRPHTVSHHESHAAAGYYTSTFSEAAIVVIDAIGEWDTLTVWEARGREMKKIYSATYPDSLGLLYSAFTQRCGFKPNEEEYIMMAAAAHGNPEYVDDINKEFFSHEGKHELHLKQNVHLGIGDWLPEARVPELAASIQHVTEQYLIDLFQWVGATTRMKNLVFMGGVALNCVANAKVAARGVFDNIWIMPNPGDAGSSLGAALAYKKDFVEWKGPYLGTDIGKPKDRQMDSTLDEVIAALLKGDVVGFTNGRAEFGPRALGNRSLLADPRYRGSRSKMNSIKNREPFRPFAASILEEEAHNYFVMPITTSPYMQYVARVKEPRAFPAICHIDSTCRVQTVNREQNLAFHELLKRWFAATGCPMLMNTSLNIKGSPLVNTWEDAEAFMWVHDVKVF